MRINETLESGQYDRIPSAREFFPIIFSDAIDYTRHEEAVGHIELLKGVDSVQSSWAESIGLRLMIKDFFVRQKGAISHLHQNYRNNLNRASILGFHATMDIEIDNLNGYDRDKRRYRADDIIQGERINRLISEPKPRLIPILSRFIDQPISSVAETESLLDSVSLFRESVVFDLEKFRNNEDSEFNQIKLFDEQSVDICKTVDKNLMTVLSLE